MNMDIKNTNPWFMFSVLFMCFSLKFRVSNGADTISVNQSLSGDQTIVSAGGVFVLGFFNPGNTPNAYIGIWFKKVSEQTVVWVANRDKPISDRYSSVLRITNGNLVLLDESQKSIWSTNSNSTSTSSIEAVLLDEGNLVLRDRSKSNNSTEPIWQSFDNPTHTLLPGMKIGFKKRSNVNLLLTSWKNKEDPAPGLFSLELDPTNGSNQYIMLWNRSEMYWASGAWNGKIFSSVPEMRLDYIYDYRFVSDENGRYFVYENLPSYLKKVPKFTSRFIIDASGKIKQLYWLDSRKAWFQFWSTPRQPCEVYAYCGAFGSCGEQTESFCRCVPGFKPKSEHDWNFLKDYSGGCVRETQLECEKQSLAGRKSDRFVADRWVVELPEHPQPVAVGSIMECEKTCMSKCSCTSYVYENNSCSIWIRDLLGLQTLVQCHSTGKTIYIKLAAAEFSSSTVSVIGVAVGSVAFVLLLGLVVIVYWRRKKRTRKTAANAMEGSLVAFAYKDLRNATKNFSEKLGAGGFGSVFKGVLPDLSVVAVKKLESINQGEKQFRAEVSSIRSIQHVNLVRLCGFCSAGTRKLLVYDYMANGSLDSHLFNREDSKFLDWKTRYKIALGTARGLVYLHEKCRSCIIHCDIKPQNILLDAEFSPKVADFGLAKLHGREFSRVLTTIRGTRGYLAPEWISGVAITAKVDVYSYGMMLFEFISGRRNSEESEDGEVNFFPTRAVSRIAEGGDLLSLLDHRLEGNADVEELSRMLNMACWCIQDDESQRPSMGQVVQVLEGVMDVTQSPMPRSLQILVKKQESLIFYTESSPSQSSQTWRNTSTTSSQA